MIPQVRYLGPDDGEIRTGEPEYPGGRIYPTDPAAHAKLREILGVPPGGTRQLKKISEAHEQSKKWGGGKEKAMARKNKIVFSAAQLAEAARRWDAGESLVKIAADYNVSSFTLTMRLREAGYEKRREGKDDRRKVKRKDERSALKEPEQPVEESPPQDGVLLIGGRPHGRVEIVEDEEEQPELPPGRPDVNGFIDYLMGAREAWSEMGVLLTGTFHIAGPTATLTIDLHQREEG